MPQGTTIEVKKTGNGLSDGTLADQLILDIERYEQHEQCTHLICFVYALLGLLLDPRGLKRHFETVTRRIGATVVVPLMPRRASLLYAAVLCSSLCRSWTLRCASGRVLVA